MIRLSELTALKQLQISITFDNLKPAHNYTGDFRFWYKNCRFSFPVKLN